MGLGRRLADHASPQPECLTKFRRSQLAAPRGQRARQVLVEDARELLMSMGLISLTLGGRLMLTEEGKQRLQRRPQGSRRGSRHQTRQHPLGDKGSQHPAPTKEQCAELLLLARLHRTTRDIEGRAVVPY
jgi:hypothetical protein